MGAGGICRLIVEAPATGVERACERVLPRCRRWRSSTGFAPRRSMPGGSTSCSGCVGGWRQAFWPGGSVGPGACPCSAASTRHVATCATIAGQPVTTMGLDAIRGAQGAVSGDRHPPSGRSGELVPGGAPGARPCAVVRRTRRRAGAVCGTAVRAGWGRPPGGVAWPAPPDRRRAGRRRRAVPTGESAPLNQSGRQGRNVDHTTRWAWARTTLGIAYHDAEWGVPVHDDRILYGATKWPRLVARIAEAGSVAGRGCSPSPQDMPDAQHVLVLPVAGWVNRPPDNQIAYLREEQRGLLAWRLGWARRVPVVGRGGTQRWRPTQCAH